MKDRVVEISGIVVAVIALLGANSGVVFFSIGGLRDDIGSLRQDVSGLRQEMSDFRQEFTDFKVDISQRVARLEVLVEGLIEKVGEGD